MSYKEILNNINLVKGLFDNNIYLAIISGNDNNINKTRAKKVLTDNDIKKLIFFLSKEYCEKYNKNTLILESPNQIITINIENKENL